MASPAAGAGPLAVVASATECDPPATTTEICPMANATTTEMRPKFANAMECDPPATTKEPNVQSSHVRQMLWNSYSVDFV